MKYISFLFSCFIFTSTFAIKINGTINNPNSISMPANVFLNSFSLLDERKKTYTETVSADGHYLFDLDLKTHGYYYLTIGNANYYLFLSPSENEIRVINTLGSQDSFKIENSPENEAYKEYDAVNAKYFPTFLTLFQEHFFDTIDEQLKTYYNAYFPALNEVAKKYPNTYTAKNLVRMRMFASEKEIAKQKNVRAFLSTHFLDHFSWTASEMLDEGSYNDCFMSYLAFMIDTSSNSFKEYYDKNYSEKSGINLDIYKYAQKQLFEYFPAANQESRLVYFIQKSLNDPRMKDLGTTYRMNLVNKILPGNHFIEITGEQADGSLANLSTLIATHKYSLLLFYSPDCSHCIESMPEIKRIYDEFHNKGFDIYALSLLDDKTKWQQFITDKQMTWTNVLLHREAGKMDAAADYYVTNTPTLVLFDQKGVILQRYTTLTKVEDALKTLLK
ncbi:MAG TPA: TlpA disulfide reductase family protein [Chitinophagales bacterium]